MVIFLSFQANAMYDTELAESIQKGRQHIQPWVPMDTWLLLELHLVSSSEDNPLSVTYCTCP